jgi:hypothetical protein
VRAHCRSSRYQKPRRRLRSLAACLAAGIDIQHPLRTDAAQMVEAHPQPTRNRGPREAMWSGPDAKTFAGRIGRDLLHSGSMAQRVIPRNRRPAPQTDRAPTRRAKPPTC